MVYELDGSVVWSKGHPFRSSASSEQPVKCEISYFARNQLATNDSHPQWSHSPTEGCSSLS